MNTLFITIALFVNFVHPVNHGQQRAAAQPVAIVQTACVPHAAVNVPMPELADYFDGDGTPAETAIADWKSDLAWWSEQFNVCH